jgi:hypothetical protein
MKFNLSFILLAVSFVFAVERIGTPISPSLWDSYLPNPAHPSYASNLGALKEGRLTFGFQNADLAHLSLSTPGLQIISANTRWKNLDEESRWLYDSKNKDLANGAYYRDFFLVAGGTRLSNMLSLKNWDLGIGGTFKNISVEDEDSKSVWRSYLLGMSFSLSMNNLIFSGSWDKIEQRYLIAYNKPSDLQAGLEFYQNFDDLSSFGVQTGAEKIFYEGLKVHGGIRWQFADRAESPNDALLLTRIEFMLNFGTSIRFRPYRPASDPQWLKPIISPFDAAFLYDFEISFDSNVDVGYGYYNWLISISKWF